MYLDITMSDSIIVAQNISKRYRLGLQEKGDKTLAGQLLNIVKTPFKNFRRLTNLSKFSEDDDSVFWALKDINFEVKKGEVLGVIGKNGAGKSTLLKILSRITDPTSGLIKIHGRVASLLEVGTGFHPELTGRENVYMNGTILGMRRREIDQKFAEIVEFSGIEKFIDTPVKFYSSGMKVRLGFAVAAHLDPEILIVDEVLAVGDAEFQAKCLGKMEDVTKNQGRTVLFVSHNMGAITQLCKKGALLMNGTLEYYGSVDEAVKKYLKSNQSKSFVKGTPRDPNHFDRIYLTNTKGDERNDFAFNEDFVIVTQININDWNPKLELSLSAYDNMLRRIFTKNIPLLDYYNGAGSLFLQASFSGNFLLPGTYSWLISINHPRIRTYDVQDNILHFTIHETGSEFFNRASGGCVFPPKSEIKSLDNGN